MQVSGPRPNWLTLRWRMLGAPFRIQPLFWLAAGALAWGYYAQPKVGGWGAFAGWVACFLFSVLVHELGHVIAGRLFGVRPEAVLYGLGSLTLGLEALPRRRDRIAVLLGGPAASLLLAGLVWVATPPGQAPEFLRQRPAVATAVLNAGSFLLLINLVWGLLNVVPVWPLDGGRILDELCEGALGPPGAAVALGVCLFVSGLLAYVVGGWVRAQAPLQFDPHGAVAFQMYCILLAFCVLFIASGLRALVAEHRRYRAEAPPAARKP